MYTRKILERFGIDKCNPKDIPIPASTILQNAKLDLDKYSLLDRDKASLYQQIVRLTIYLLNYIRPDIIYAIRQLARHIAKPNDYYLIIEKLLLYYLNRSVSLGIVYSPTQLGLDYIIWSDAT